MAQVFLDLRIGCCSQAGVNDTVIRSMHAALVPGPQPTCQHHLQVPSALLCFSTLAQAVSAPGYTMAEKTSKGGAEPEQNGNSDDNTATQLPRWVPHTPERLAFLNLSNTPGKDGIIRGSILPVGQKQSLLSLAVAYTTLITFVAWPYSVAALCVASALSLPAQAYLSGFKRKK